jgi:hypothetical protein
VADGGATGDVQNAANRIVSDAQTIANSVVDLGEEAADTVFKAAITAVDLLGTALRSLQGKVTGGSS